jgi:hypothetical protein
MTRIARSSSFVASAALLALAPVLVLGAISVARAADAPPAPRAPEPSEVPTRDDIRGWIAQLADDGYSVRDKAQRNLTAAGVAAIDDLIEAAKGDNAEVRSRSFAVLTKQLQSEDNAVMLPTKTALEKLAAGSDRTLARTASEALLQIDPLAWEMSDADSGVVRIAGGGIMIRGGGTSISRTESGNRRTFHMQTANESIDISKSDAAGIEIFVTRKINGRELKGRYSAKTPDELKAKHPKAFALFDQYMQQTNGNVNAAIFARKAIIARPAIVVRAKPAAPPAPKAPEPATAPEPNHVDVPQKQALPQLQRR